MPLQLLGRVTVTSWVAGPTVTVVISGVSKYGAGHIIPFGVGSSRDL